MSREEISCFRNMVNHDGDVMTDDDDDSEAEYWRDQDDLMVEENMTKITMQMRPST
jgi:hypothetical protein